MQNTAAAAPESTASLWSALWSEFIAAKRAGHAEKAAELKQRLNAFDSQVLGLG